MIGSVALAPWAIIIVDTWMWTPYIMLLCLAGLRSIPAYLYEAAEIDRANALQKFWYITLPRVLPFLMLAVLFRGIENFKMFRYGGRGHFWGTWGQLLSWHLLISNARHLRNGEPAIHRHLPSFFS